MYFPQIAHKHSTPNASIIPREWLKKKNKSATRNEKSTQKNNERKKKIMAIVNIAERSSVNNHMYQPIICLFVLLFLHSLSMSLNDIE